MAINGVLKWSLIFCGSIPAVMVLRVGIVIYFAVTPGLTMHQTARILVEDAKFGGRAKDRAIDDGDAILPVLVSESGNFKKLNERNSLWIGDVLGGIRTDRSESIAKGLYARSDQLPHLVGALALAETGRLDAQGIDELVRTVEHGDRSEDELAMLALGKAHAKAAGPILVDVLSRCRHYWRQASACDAVARIGYREAVPALELCLRSRENCPLPNAFRALISLGDREAVPLAIERIKPSIRGNASGWVVKELEKVTRRDFGYDQQAWMDWWRSVEYDWRIPEDFRKPFDDQPEVY